RCSMKSRSLLAALVGMTIIRAMGAASVGASVSSDVLTGGGPFFLGHVLEAGLEVREQILYLLDAAGEPDESFGDAELHPHLGWHRRVGHGRGVTDERLDA